MERIIKIVLSDQVCCGVTTVRQVCQNVDKRLQMLCAEESEIGAISMALPFLGGDCFIPKPAIITDNQLNLSLADHKYHRFMKYLRLSELSDYYRGSFDFAANARIRFGSYQKYCGVDTFAFAKETGLYVMVRTESLFSQSLLERIACAVKEVTGLAELQVYACEPDLLWKQSLQLTDSPVLTLNHLDVTDETAERLNELTADAAYDAAYDSTGRRLLLRAGACFRHRKVLPKNVLSVNIVRSSL